ncbi:MAG TPA: energy transducer TonB [Panacibacter sp.]|nr:energy transducer TonB [Panacibacter sp.]HNP45749.1 energy transducer TonB [Panacibacter sp.]
MKYFFVSVLLTASFFANAQTIDSVKPGPGSNDSKDSAVRIEAQFPGGPKGWQRYLEASLNADLGAKYLRPKKGQSIVQTAVVSFLVDTLGNISEVQVLNPKDVHSKLAAESARVISEGPKWKPATINGQKVIYRQKQTISWQVSAE